MNEKIICTSRICKTKDVFGKNSLFDKKFKYMLAISTKSTDTEKFGEANLVLVGLSFKQGLNGGKQISW
jgi:hypothetical protein